MFGRVIAREVDRQPANSKDDIVDRRTHRNPDWGETW
jgi:hypothetical protein